MNFSRGYKPVRKKMDKPKFLMSCTNCEYFYQAVGDKEEVCQNPNVIKYDMVVEETRVFCNKWRAVE